MAIPLPQVFGGTEVRLTSGHGPRKAPVKGASSYHKGVDLASPIGTDVHSLASGRVMDVGYNSAHGIYVHIDHGNGYVTKYSHLNERPNLQIGQNITSGQQIAKVGKTGITTGPHLHLALEKNGRSINPYEIKDLEHLVNPSGSQSARTQVEPKQLFTTSFNYPAKDSTEKTENKKTLSNMVNPSQTNKNANQGTQYGTKGPLASEIMGKGIGEIDANELMKLAMNQGYSQRDAKRAVKGLEKFKQLGADMVFDPKANRYNVIFKEGEDVRIDPRQGRRLGSNVAFGAADLIGLGRDVNMLASVISRKRFSETPEVKAETKTQTKEFPTYNLEDFSSKLKSQMETGLKPQLPSLRRTGTTSVSEAPPPKLPVEDNLTRGGEQDAHFAHVGNAQPKSKEYEDIPLWQDFASRAMASVARVAGAPAYAAEGLTKLFGLPTEGFGQKEGERSLVGKYADWTRKKEAEYLQGVNPNRGGWLYQQAANAPEYAVAGRAVKGLFSGAKNAQKVLSKTPKPSSAASSTPKPLIGEFRQDVTGAAKAAKAATDAALKARQANKVKATIERAGQINRMARQMGEGFEKGGKMSAASIIGLPKGQEGIKFGKNADIQPGRKTFGNWLGDNAVNIARYTAPFIGEAIARKELNVKPMRFTPTELMTGVVRDLPKNYQPMLNRVENRGSDLLTNLAASKFTDAYNRDKDFQYNMQNQMSKLQQQQAILDRTNQGRIFNAQNKNLVDRINMMKDLQLAEARYKSKLSPMLAVNQMVSDDISQKNYFDAFTKAKEMELAAKKGELTYSELAEGNKRKGGKFKIKK